MVFNRQNNLQHELGRQIRQAKQLAINQDVEFKILHNDECIDAEKNIFTKLVARITKQHNEAVNRVMKYRESHWK